MYFLIVSNLIFNKELSKCKAFSNPGINTGNLTFFKSHVSRDIIRFKVSLISTMFSFSSSLKET